MQLSEAIHNISVDYIHRCVSQQIIVNTILYMHITWYLQTIPRIQLGKDGIQLESLEHMMFVTPTIWYPWLQVMVRLWPISKSSLVITVKLYFSPCGFGHLGCSPCGFGYLDTRWMY